MFDIVFINSHPHETTEWRKLKSRFPLAKKAGSVKEAQDISLTEFVWVVYDDLQINDFFDFNYTPDQWSQQYIHVFKNGTTYDGVALIPKYVELHTKETLYRFYINKKEVDIQASIPILFDRFYVTEYNDYLTALAQSKTEMFWIVPDYVNTTDRFGFNTYFSHNDQYHRTINHAYLNGKYHDGIVLCSKHSKFSKREFDYKFIAHKKEIDVVVSTPKPYDIVFISYQEPNADEYYQALVRKFPRAKRVHGVKGIHQAHIEAAKLCTTDMFWIVDGDALIDSNFNFDYQVARWDKDVVHVWRSINPINDLVYGYGGVKLFPTDLTINMDTTKTDMTTSISSKFKAVYEVSNITGFNTDPFNTWKSAFRECVKLSSKVIDRQKDDETQQRLQTWCSAGKDRQFGEYALDGAKMGALYGARNRNKIDMLKKINDFDWLEEQFNARNF